MDHPLSINTNGGIKKYHQKCDISYINDVWYRVNSITIILSMKDMTEKFHATMTLKEEPALLVHMPNKIVKLKQSSNELYSMDPNDENSFILTKKYYQFMNTLEENLKYLSPRQKSKQINLEISTKQW